MRAKGTERHSPARNGRLHRVLRVRLFYKVLLANAAIVLTFSLLATLIVARTQGAEAAVGVILALAVAAALVSLAVNALIIQLALEPLRLLKATADKIQEGDMDARVPASPLADPDMQRVTAATNGMLDRLADYRRRLREVAARALNASEEERRRISLELHDDASQRLAAILMRLRIARSVEDGEVKDRMLEDVRRELAETADGLRRYAQGLRPPALDELGLGPAIESHVRHVAETAALPVEVRTDGVGRLESPEAELALYRIVQEAITNALRHSRARRIGVAVQRRHDAVVATVTDDGVGFDADAILQAPTGEHGLGLFGMRERAEYVGGRVAILSTVGKGTTVRAAVPAHGAGGTLPAELVTADSSEAE
jgi:two-component system, NarL family, sensor histidine kinase UhpB